jgi:integrase
MAAAAVRLIALTGLRREEACALRWNGIDFAGCCLHDIIGRIADHPINRIDQLLPWNWTPPAAGALRPNAA